MTKIPDYINRATDMDNVLLGVFEDIKICYKTEDWLTSPAIMTTKNIILEKLNNKIGDKIDDESIRYNTTDTIDNHEEYGLVYPTELLNSMPGDVAIPYHRLNLKIGCIFTVLLNHNPLNGHFNGLRYILENATTNILFLILDTVSKKGNKLALSRMNCALDKNYQIPGFTGSQFRGRVYIAMTVNKAQGQSIKSRLGLDIHEE